MQCTLINSPVNKHTFGSMTLVRSRLDEDVIFLVV